MALPILFCAVIGPIVFASAAMEVDFGGDGGVAKSVGAEVFRSARIFAINLLLRLLLSSRWELELVKARVPCVVVRRDRGRGESIAVLINVLASWQAPDDRAIFKKLGSCGR